ncbi:hypothetical protein [Leptolyngbya iicbica]|uniref:DnaD domain protein n=2 Tax=Cyanophyceae TaxID=3028117 RepID=A0A4V2E1S3_9CYAN|nr:hypothetical protein [Leptolyngbya sp. LK]RZM75053.1 hypothetical protein DYY88_22345 [Leptolyngbya sp. LK]
MIASTGSDRDFEQATLLMQEYCFDLRGFEAGELVAIWHERLEAEPSWIRAAVLEALYLGRYKAFSVEQILQGWKRRGHPVRHFNSEFERIVFGPIDPIASKYAALTSLSPSELLSPQSESSQSVVGSPDEEPAAATVEGATTTPSEPNTTTDDATKLTEAPAAEREPQQQDLFSQPAPIQKFQPRSEASEFYQRLQAVAHHSE